MKLYGHPESGHAFKVRFFLEHAAISHDYERVDIDLPRTRRPAAFRDRARFGEVPLLVLDDGRPVAQSNAILEHLAQWTGAWGAENAARFDTCREWLYWEANRLGMCLPQLRSHERFEDHGIVAGTRDWLLARYALDIGTLDAAFADGRDWVVEGAGPSIADFSLCGYLVHAHEAAVDVPAGVARWLERLQRLPGWRPPYEMLA